VKDTRRHGGHHPALTAAETPQHPNLCGPCESCREALLDYIGVYGLAPSKDDERAASRPYWRLFSSGKLAPKVGSSEAVESTPTETALRKHEKRHGKEGIAEIRQAFPVEKPRRRTRAETYAAVAQLRIERRTITEIMSQLGVSEKTVRNALAKAA
jgi:hypothetical protein